MNQSTTRPLFASLDLLPEEAVLWQGGPSPRTSAALALQAGLSLLLAILVALPVIATFAFLARVDDNSSRATAAQSPPPSSQPRGGRPTESAASHAQGNVPPWFFPFVFLSAFGMVASIILAGIFFASIITLVRVLHAWYIITTERVCIQTGWLHKSLVTVDLDKIISLRASGSWVQRRFGLHSIEVIHAGSRGFGPHATWPYSFLSNFYTIGYVALDLGLFSKLSNAWLPRDNSQRTKAK